MHSLFPCKRIENKKFATLYIYNCNSWCNLKRLIIDVFDVNLFAASGSAENEVIH